MDHVIKFQRLRMRLKIHLPITEQNETCKRGFC